MNAIIAAEVMETRDGGSQESTWKKRWRRWRWLISLFAAGFYALIGWLRLSEALRNWDYLRAIRLYPDPRYIAISGGARGFLFSIAFLLILLRYKHAPIFARLSYAIYLGWMLSDRIWISTRESFFMNIASTLLFSILSLFFAFVLIQPRDYRKGKFHEPEA